MARKRKRTNRAGKPPACPECGSGDVLPVVHGPLSAALKKSVDQGKAVIANREEWEGMTEWYCKACGCDWSGAWRRFKKSAKS
jgi:hypothetical protein